MTENSLIVASFDIFCIGVLLRSVEVETFYINAIGLDMIRYLHRPRYQLYSNIKTHTGNILLQTDKDSCTENNYEIVVLTLR